LRIGILIGPLAQVHIAIISDGYAWRKASLFTAKPLAK